MAAHVIKAIVARNGLDPAQIDDVILGAANQAGEDNRNVGRMAALLAGFPVEVAGQTVNRLCGSSLQAVISAAHAIAYGDGAVFIAGGVESMTRAPFVMAKPSAAFQRGEQTLYDTTLGWRFTNPRLADAYYPYSMGETAENVVQRCGVSREDQDAFALASQQRWADAHAAGRFADEIVPIEVPDGRETRTIDSDEHPRPDATLESLGKLKPALGNSACDRWRGSSPPRSPASIPPPWGSGRSRPRGRRSSERASASTRSTSSSSTRHSRRRRCRSCVSWVSIPRASTSTV